MVWLIAAGLLLGASERHPAPEVEQRLASLRPDNVGGYLLLGERLVEQPQSAAVGRETLALAVLLAADTNPSMAASAAVALASAAQSSDERRGLWSLAVELDPIRADDLAWASGLIAGAGDLDRDAGRMLGSLRVNDRDAAVALAASIALRERIIEEGVRLGHDQRTLRAVLAKWESDALNDPCRGQLTVRSRNGADVLSQPCPDPSYHHGLRTDSSDWAMMVGIEMSLLGATPDFWSTQAAVGLDLALSVWTLERLTDVYGVSRTRSVRRSGRWTEP
jgi:hypothetical protein